MGRSMNTSCERTPRRMSDRVLTFTRGYDLLLLLSFFLSIFSRSVMQAAIGERNLGDTAEMPGPGRTSSRAASVGRRTARATLQVPPRATMSGRNKFGSPFAKW